MKEAIIVDLDGLFKDVTLVEDAVTGVTPIHKYVEDKLNPNVLTEVLVGYQIAVKVPEDLGIPKWPKWDFVAEGWVEGRVFDLTAYKEVSINSLDALCNKTVLGTFVSSAMGVPHIYVFDMEAQMNFAGADQAFTKNKITTVEWNTRDAGVLIHDATQFDILWSDAFAHKIGIIAKFRGLKGKIELPATDTKEAVDLIVAGW